MALLVLPGPGLLLVFAGLAILASQYEWARRLLRPVRKRALQASEASVRTPWRIAASAAAGAALLIAGAAWIVLPKLPYGGLGTGISLIVSGLLLLALLWYSYQRTHGGDVPELPRLDAEGKGADEPAGRPSK